MMTPSAARAVSKISELGFAAAEIRMLQAQLARACARQDVDSLCDLAEDLLARHRQFNLIYREMLAALPCPTRDWVRDRMPV